MLDKKQNKLFRNLFFAFGAGAFVISCAFFFYALQFGFLVSKNRTVWGEFGDFMSVFVAIANLVVVSSLTYFIAKIEDKRDEENRNLENSKIRPILIFKDIGKKWACRNVGEGAAMNIMIAYKTKSTLSWENPIKIYSLVPKEEFEIEWRKYQVFQWSAVYYDIHGTVFTSICENDDTVFEIDKNELLSFTNNYKRLEDVKNISFD